jgi:hypothetical protein
MEMSSHLHAPSHFTPRGRVLGIHWTGGWVGLSQSGWEEEKKSHHCPCWELNPGHPAHSVVSILTELPWFLDREYYSIISVFSYCIHNLYHFINTTPQPSENRNHYFKLFNYLSSFLCKDSSLQNL